MSEEKQLKTQFDNDPERTLITLEQLSQTIEVMTSVVNRLRQHLSEQLNAQIEAQQQTNVNQGKNQMEVKQPGSSENKQEAVSKQKKERESFVVEIRQQENDPVRKNTKTLY